MSMSPQEVQEHMMTYLESTECQIIEKSPYHVTVKLSPQADRQLTGRPYYWGFVDRTERGTGDVILYVRFRPGTLRPTRAGKNRGRAAAGPSPVALLRYGAPPAAARPRAHPTRGRHLRQRKAAADLECRPPGRLLPVSVRAAAFAAARNAVFGPLRAVAGRLLQSGNGVRHEKGRTSFHRNFPCQRADRFPVSRSAEGTDLESAPARKRSYSA